MKFNTKLTSFDFDLTAYKKALAASMKSELQKAIKHWLRAVVRDVPTWSGASRATFEMIAKKAGESISYGPQRSLKDRKSLGEKESTAVLELDSDRGIYYFEWGTTLRYFILNNSSHEQYDENDKDLSDGKVLYKKGLKHPGPYRIEDKGLSALQSVAKTVSLLSPYSFMRRKKA